MALFGFKKKHDAKPVSSPEEERPAAAPKKKAEGKTLVSHRAAVPGAAGMQNLARVLKRPRITEKASLHLEQSAYLFDVDSDATKRDVARAVFALYSVMPRKVRIVSYPAKEKRNMRTGKRGVKSGGKKAYVYLKKGESITVT